MDGLGFETAGVPIRDTVARALPRVWARTGAPGAWLTADRRLAVARETRNVAGCRLCDDRKAAVSPYAVKGTHDGLGELPEVWIDVVHRVVSDPGRLSEHWYRQATDGGITPEEYVEVVGVIATVTGIDTFFRALDLAAPDLPDAVPGEPAPDRPDDLIDGFAWMPTLDPAVEGDLQRQFYPGGSTINIRRALTLVPSTARDFWEMADALYLNPDEVYDFTGRHRAIDRAQIELIAARVSALNQCTY